MYPQGGMGAMGGMQPSFQGAGGYPAGGMQHPSAKYPMGGGMGMAPGYTQQPLSYPPAYAPIPGPAPFGVAPPGMGGAMPVMGAGGMIGGQPLPMAGEMPGAFPVSTRWRCPKSIHKKQVKKEAEAAFYIYDLNKDGKLSHQEFYPAFVEVCNRTGIPPPPQHEIAFVFSIFESHKTHAIDLKHFKKMCKQLFGHKTKKFHHHFHY
jgi:Ca2+-binding EF-hand superfamily protein